MSWITSIGIMAMKKDFLGDSNLPKDQNDHNFPGTFRDTLFYSAKEYAAVFPHKTVEVWDFPGGFDFADFLETIRLSR